MACNFNLKIIQIKTKLVPEEEKIPTAIKHTFKGKRKEKRGLRERKKKDRNEFIWSAIVPNTDMFILDYTYITRLYNFILVPKYLNM